ncbi:MAG: 50S ribosomal protein L3 [Bdellovibrionales bacterium]|nr:50S ribosomal protein L3 [Bdellovibrionales bacterium]
MSTNKLYPEGLLGKKLGMSHVFTEDGNCVPVTVLEVGPCYILDVKNEAQHGYTAVRMGFEPKKQQRVNKPDLGNFAKAGKGAFYHSKEIRCDAEALGWESLGQEVSVGEIFEAGQKVDVTGISMGRGFAGVVKKYGVRGQPASRGTHEMFRHIGSIGCRKSPGRVFKNRKMPGHYGHNRVTVQNLKVVAVKPEQNILLVKGAVPGPKGTMITVKKAAKGYRPSTAKDKAA